MNAPANGVSRRRLLTRLFTETQGNTGLAAQDDLRRYTEGVLWAALSVSDSESYIAGDDGMVFYHDGESWSKENLPSNLPVHALCAAGDRVYSVGWLGQICERVDGDWRSVQGGENSPARENLPLFAIAADSNDHLWAVGDQGRVVHFDGRAWSELQTDCNANLRAVLPLPGGRVLTAGNGGAALMFDRGSWCEVETGTGCTITSMALLGDDSVVAVGGEYDVASGQFRGRIFCYQDGTWEPVEAEGPLPRLRRIRRFDDALLICGDEGVAFRWDSGGVHRLTTRVRYDLHDLLCTMGGDVLICGDGGTLLRETELGEGQLADSADDKNPWEIIHREGKGCTLRSIWDLGEGKLIAAGDGGAVLHIDGDSVTPGNTPQGLRIHDLWASSPRNVFAACDNATILHFDGKNWSVAHRGDLETALLAVTGFGPHDIFAVGDNGYCLRYDGLMWRQLETGTQQELYALWGRDSQHLLGVGGGGLVLRFNGERWKTFSAGTDHDLYGVSGSGLNRIFLCGLAGTVIRFEDNTWHKEFTGVRSDLHGLTHRDGVFYAAGSAGTLLRNSDGLWQVEESPAGTTLQSLAATDRGIYACGAGGIVLRRS